VIKHQDPGPPNIDFCTIIITIPSSHLRASSQPARLRLEKSLGLTTGFSLVQVGKGKERKLRIVPGFQLEKKTATDIGVFVL